jgi:hypothetical protein
MSEVFDGWRLFGEPIAYDAIQKVGTFMKFWVDYRKDNNINETRVDALPQNVLAEAFRITCDTELKASLEKYFSISWKTLNKDRGYYVPNMRKYAKGFEKIFMLSYLAEGLNETYSIIGDEYIVDMITGITDYALNESYINPCYAVLYETPIDTDELMQKKEEAQNSLRTSCDCSIFKWGSEEWKECSAFRDWRILSLLEISHRLTGKKIYNSTFHDVYEGGLEKGKKKKHFHTWKNSFDRMLESPRSDTTPPSSIQDLKTSSLSDGQLKLSWTAPQEAQRYQIKYASKPIVENINFLEEPDLVDTHVNWWAATNLADEPMPASPGQSQEFTLKNLESGTYYFAIRSYDEASNISPLSNIDSVSLDGNSASLQSPSNLQVTISSD